MFYEHKNSKLNLFLKEQNLGCYNMWILYIKGMRVYSICWGSCSIYFRIQFSQSPILDFKAKWIGDLLKLLLAHLCQVDICRITIVKKGLENRLYLFLLKYLVQHHGGGVNMKRVVGFSHYVKLITSNWNEYFCNFTLSIHILRPRLILFAKF